MAEKRKIVVIGGGGHAKSVIGVLKNLPEYEIAGYTDVNPECWCKGLDVPFLGGEEVLPELKEQGVECAVLGIGSVGRSVQRRNDIVQKAIDCGFEFPPVVAPSAVVDQGARLGQGCVVMPGAVVNIGAQVGEFCIVNTACVVEHDVVLGKNVHLASGVVTAGAVSFGADTHVGTGARIIQKINVGKNAVIGAGAVVIRNVPDGALVVGVPAKERV